MPAVEPDLDLFLAARLGLEGAYAISDAFVVDRRNRCGIGQ
jgi:hypothetical protein